MYIPLCTVSNEVIGTDRHTHTHARVSKRVCVWDYCGGTVDIVLCSDICISLHSQRITQHASRCAVRKTEKERKCEKCQKSWVTLRAEVSNNPRSGSAGLEFSATVMIECLIYSKRTDEVLLWSSVWFICRLSFRVQGR